MWKCDVWIIEMGFFLYHSDRLSGYTVICHFLQQGRWTSLMLASREGHVECMKALLEAGAQANLQNEVSGYTDVVQCLLVMYMCGLRQ